MHPSVQEWKKRRWVTAGCLMVERKEREKWGDAAAVVSTAPLLLGSLILLAVSLGELMNQRQQLACASSARVASPSALSVGEVLHTAGSHSRGRCILMRLCT